MQTAEDIRIDIRGIRNRLDRIPYSVVDADERERALALCQEAQTEVALGEPDALTHAAALVWQAGIVADEVRS